MHLDVITILLAATSIVVGTTLQRVSGAGVGLVVAPTLALLLGPAIGVFATNCVTIVSATAMLIVRRREVEWRKAGWILLAAIPGVILGAILVRDLSAAILQISIGVIVMIALVVSLTSNRLNAERVPGSIGIAGAIGGLFNTTAGIAAPALVVYSRLANWKQPGFGATLQPIFLGMGAMSIVAKSLFGSTGFAEAPEWWLVLIVLAAVIMGIRIGELLIPFVTPVTATWIALGVAGLSGVVAIIRGVLTLVAGG